METGGRDVETSEVMVETLIIVLAAVAVVLMVGGVRVMREFKQISTTTALHKVA